MYSGIGSPLSLSPFPFLSFFLILYWFFDLEPVNWIVFLHLQSKSNKTLLIGVDDCVYIQRHTFMSLCGCRCFCFLFLLWLLFLFEFFTTVFPSELLLKYEWQQITRTLLSILTNVTHSVVDRFAILPLMFDSSCFFPTLCELFQQLLVSLLSLSYIDLLLSLFYFVEGFLPQRYRMVFHWSLSDH